ncbi:hypothetical protein [Lysinibacillus sp. OL1]|uniref:hypothetical protein n=1 Tax=Lysinibacillus sp. OL1 TaxID=2517243 RepID=UPI00187D4832|nr:hypothetical protein [Lysinibacillus sp. OL1]
MNNLLNNNTTEDINFNDYEKENCNYCNKEISAIESYNWGGCCVKCAVEEDL